MINDLLLDEDEAAVAPPPSDSYPHAFAGEPAMTKSAAARPAEPQERIDDATRLARALERLSNRIEAAETRSALAITGIDQSVLGLVARIDNTERVGHAVASRVDRAVDDLRTTHEALSDRLKRMEADTSGRQSLESMRALEQALGRLAAHVYTQDERNTAAVSSLRQEIAGALARMEDSGRALDERVDTTLARAAQQVEAIADKAELRAHGAARDVSDRVKELEGRFRDQLASFEARLAERAESGEGFGQLEGALTRIQHRLQAAESTTDAAIKGLSATFSSLDAKLEAVRAAAGGDDLRQLVEQRIEGLAENLTRSVSDVRAEMARQIEDAAKAMKPEGLARLEYNLENVQARLAQAESKQATTLAAIGEELKKVTKVLGSRLRQVEGRNDGGAAADIVREELQTVTRSLEGRLTEIEAREARAIEAVGDQVASLADKLDRRIEDSENRSAQAITQVGEHVARMSQTLQARHEESHRALVAEIKAVEARSDTRLSDALAGVTDRLQRIETDARTAVSPVQTAMSALARRLESLEAFARPPGAPVPPPIETLFSGPGKAAAQPAPRGLSAVSAPLPSFSPDLPAFEDDEPAAPPPPTRPKGGRDDVPDFAATLARLEAVRANPEPAPPPSFANDLEGDDTPEYTAELPPAEELDDGFGSYADETDEHAAPGSVVGNDYLARARQAARDSVSPEARRGQGARQARPVKPQKAGGRPPLVLAASLVALTVAGTAAVVLMRGRQADTPFTPPVRPEAAASLESTAAPLETTDALPAPDATAEPGAATPADATAGAPVPAPTPAPNASMGAEREVARVNTLSAEPTRETTRNTSPALSSPPPVQAAPPVTPTRVQAQPVTTTRVPSPAQPVIQPAPMAQPSAPPAGQAVSLETAAAQGDAISQFLLAQRLIGENDFTQAASLLQRAANQGLVAAEHRLSKLYERGQGVQRSPQEAVRRTERAALGGNVRAMHDLATYYTDGEVVTQSYAAAAEWFRKAADFGLVDSQFNLGVLYEEGLGVSRDPSEALYWFEVAARNGDPEGGRRAAAVRALLPPDTAQSVAQRAVAFRPRASDPVANGRFAPEPFAANANAEVMDVQRALRTAGYDPGGVDGVMSQQTRVAIMRFQRANGLPETGQVSPELRAALSRPR
jgi:localization factor PodJL